MKHSVFVKFIAVLLCAVSLLGAVGSALGMFALMELGLYDRSFEEAYDEYVQNQGISLAHDLARNYAAENLGGCSEELVNSAFGNYWFNNYFDWSYIGYSILDENGEVLQRQDVDFKPEHVYTYPATGDYIRFVSEMTEEEWQNQQIPVTEPDINYEITDTHTVYNVIPGDSAEISFMEVTYMDGSGEGHGRGSGLGVISLVDGMWEFVSYEPETFENPGIVQSVTFRDMAEEVIYHASYIHGVGTLYHDDVGRVVFTELLHDTPALQGETEVARISYSTPDSGASIGSDDPIGTLRFDESGNAYFESIQGIGEGFEESVTVIQIAFYDVEGTLLFAERDNGGEGLLYANEEGQLIYTTLAYEVMLPEEENSAAATEGAVGEEDFEPYSAVVVSDTDIYDSPSLLDDPFGSVAEGTEVMVLHQTHINNREWCRIGVGQWILREYLEPVGVSDETTLEETQPQGLVGTVTASMGVRSDPDTNARFVGTLSAGDQVEILQQESSEGVLWGRTAEGWIPMEYVKLPEEVDFDIQASGGKDVSVTETTVPGETVDATEVVTEPVEMAAEVTAPEETVDSAAVTEAAATTEATEVPPTTAAAETSEATTVTVPSTVPETEPALAMKTLPVENTEEIVYHSSATGQWMHAQVVYEPMPAYTVEILFADGALTYGYEWDVLEVVYSYRNELLMILGLSLLVFAVTAVYLCCAAGRKPGTDVVQAEGLNRLPLDMYAVVAVLGIGFFFAVLDSVAISYVFSRSFRVGCIFAGMGCFLLSLLIVGFLYAFVAQVKTPGGYWWRNSLCGRCLRFLVVLWNLFLRFCEWLDKKLEGKIGPAMGKLFRGIWKVVEVLCKLVWKWILIAVQLLEKGCDWMAKRLSRFFSMLPLTWQWLLAGFILILVLVICIDGFKDGNDIALPIGLLFAFGLIFYGSHCFGTLLESAKHMSKGDLDEKVDDKLLVGGFKDFANELNSLADVAVVAAQKQLKSERMKTELITNVSHDIKTPLTSIINYVDLLEKPHTPEEQEVYLEVLSRQSQRLKKLIDDLMEMSKASTGNLAVDITRVNAGEAINQALGEFADKLDKAQLTPVFRQPEEPVEMMADGRLVWRVMSNLLGNAVKYALPGTRVYLDLMQVDGRVIISMKNISREELNVNADELLERFVRGDASRNTEGSGLGLNIAQSLMELQKGQLQLLVDGDLFKVTLIFPGV